MNLWMCARTFNSTYAMYGLWLWHKISMQLDSDDLGVKNLYHKWHHFLCQAVTKIVVQLKCPQHISLEFLEHKHQLFSPLFLDLSDTVEIWDVGLKDLYLSTLALDKAVNKFVHNTIYSVKQKQLSENTVGHRGWPSFFFSLYSHWTSEPDGPHVHWCTVYHGFLH